MENPRWNDYEYELLPELKENPLEWFGNGLVKEQIIGGVYDGVLGCSICAC